MNVLVADKESRVRLALRLFLEQQQPVSCVGEAQDFSEAKSQMLRIHPDILLVDWHLEDHATPTQMMELRRLEPDLKIVVLSLFEEDRRCALASGAEAFVCKSAPVDELLPALGLSNVAERISVTGAEAGEKSAKSGDRI